MDTVKEVEVLTEPEAAKIARSSQRTFQRAREDNRMNIPFAGAGRTVLYSRSVIMKMIAEGKDLFAPARTLSKHKTRSVGRPRKHAGV